MSPDREMQTIFGSEDMLLAARQDAALKGNAGAPAQTDIGPRAPYAQNSPDVVYGDTRTVQQIAESAAAQVRTIVS